MSQQAKRTAPLFNIVSYAQRTWDFFQQDHLLGTIAMLLGVTFVKWYLDPQTYTLMLIAVELLSLTGVTGFKYHFDLKDRQQTLIEAEQSEAIITARVEKLKQFEQIDEMVVMGYHTSHVLLDEALKYVEEAEVIDNNILKLLIGSSKEAVKLIGDKIHLRTLPFKEYLEQFVGGLKDRLEPSLDELPTPLNGDEMIDEMESVEAVPLKSTEEIKDFHPETNET